MNIPLTKFIYPFLQFIIVIASCLHPTAFGQSDEFHQFIDSIPRAEVKFPEEYSAFLILDQSFNHAERSVDRISWVNKAIDMFYLDLSKAEFEAIEMMESMPKNIFAVVQPEKDKFRIFFPVNPAENRKFFNFPFELDSKIKSICCLTRMQGKYSFFFWNPDNKMPTMLLKFGSAITDYNHARAISISNLLYQISNRIKLIFSREWWLGVTKISSIKLDSKAFFNIIRDINIIKPSSQNIILPSHGLIGLLQTQNEMLETLINNRSLPSVYRDISFSQWTSEFYIPALADFQAKMLHFGFHESHTQNIWLKVNKTNGHLEFILKDLDATSIDPLVAEFFDPFLKPFLRESLEAGTKSIYDPGAIPSWYLLEGMNDAIDRESPHVMNYVAHYANFFYQSLTIHTEDTLGSSRAANIENLRNIVRFYDSYIENIERMGIKINVSSSLDSTMRVVRDSMNELPESLNITIDQLVYKQDTVRGFFPYPNADPHYGLVQRILEEVQYSIRSQIPLEKQIVYLKRMTSKGFQDTLNYLPDSLFDDALENLQLEKITRNLSEEQIDILVKRFQRYGKNLADSIDINHLKSLSRNLTKCTGTVSQIVGR